MTVWSAALPLQSATRSCAEPASLLGCEATRSSEKGAPVSSRNPSGPVRAVATCTFDSNGRPLGWVFELSPQAMRLLADAQCGLFFDVYCDDPSDLKQAPGRPQGDADVPA